MSSGRLIREPRAEDAKSAKDAMPSRRPRTFSLSFIHRPSVNRWARSSFVIAKFKTLRDTPSDIDVAVEVLEGYIEAKRRKGRNDGDVTMRLEAIQRAVPFHLHDAFLFARRQRRLPLASSFTGRMDSSAGLGSGLALGQTEMGEHDYWDMPTLDDFPLPPTHLPGPTFTPARRTAAWSVSTPCTSPAISSPSAWSIDSGSSDEMPLTPGWNSAEGRCRRLDDRAVINADEDDDSRTITGVAVSSDEIVYASRRAMELHADGVFLVGVSTSRDVWQESPMCSKRDTSKGGDVFGLAV